MSSTDQSTKEKAIEWVKDKQKVIINRFTNPKVQKESKKPFTIFMAGSPEAGKTEFSQSLVEILEEENEFISVVRIDADEIRTLVPYYDGSNSHLIQPAASLGVSKLFDHVQSKNYGSCND